MDDDTYLEGAGSAAEVVNRGWMLGSKLSIFVAFVESNVANEVELAVITGAEALGEPGEEQEASLRGGDSQTFQDTHIRQ